MMKLWVVDDGDGGDVDDGGWLFRWQAGCRCRGGLIVK